MVWPLRAAADSATGHMRDQESPRCTASARVGTSQGTRYLPQRASRCRRSYRRCSRFITGRRRGQSPNFETETPRAAHKLHRCVGADRPSGAIAEMGSALPRPISRLRPKRRIGPRIQAHGQQIGDEDKKGAGRFRKGPGRHQRKKSRRWTPTRVAVRPQN